MTQSFDVIFNLRQNKQLSKQSRTWWFETPSRPLWRHSNAGSEFRQVNSSFYNASDEFGPTFAQGSNQLTHCGRVTHICVGKLTTIGSDNGLSPERRQAITWTNVGILLNKLQWNVNRYIFIQENPFENVVWEMAVVLSRPQWVNSMSPSDAECQQSRQPLIQKMACRLFGARPLSWSVLTNC